METNTIYNAKIADLGLIIDDHLIISDIHIGYEGALNREGIMVPRFQYKKILERIIEIIRKYEPKKVIVNGDLKHEFGRITSQEWKESMDFIEFLKANFQETILIKGNHDNFTRFIAEKTGLEVYESYAVDDHLIMHGDKLPDEKTLKNSETIIIGHEHPCIGIRNGERLEKIKCYLKGSYHDKDLIVMPSFNFVTEGSDILHEKPLSPFLKNIKTDEFGVYGVENFEVLYFGRIKDILKVKDKFY
ncbi:MAG: metallophosphoesterase [Methanobacterium sp. ERen5]|nr:MAG: metallophosphoesterase [Methanobacterium sp. ERen5]